MSEPAEPYLRAYRGLLGFFQRFETDLPSAVADVSEFVDATISRGGVLYLNGSGRSFYVLEAFARRVSKPPINAQVRPLVFSSQPKIAEQDALIVCSGTGLTELVVELTQAWTRLNKHVLAITSSAGSHDTPLASLSDKFEKRVIIPDSLTRRDVENRRRRSADGSALLLPSDLYGLYDESDPALFPASKFELGVLLLLECVVAQLFVEYRSKEPSRAQK